MLDACLELGIAAIEGFVRKIVDNDVRVHTVAFDQPGTFRTIDSDFRGGSHAAVYEPPLGREPDFSAPGASANELAQPKPATTFGERLAIAGGAFIAEHDQVAAKGILHVPGRLAHARLPIKPRLAPQLAQNPRVNVASIVVTNINDESLSVKDREKIPRPLRDVTGTHRPKMDISNFSPAEFF